MSQVSKRPVKARRYQEAWHTLKQYKTVAMVPTNSKDPAIFKKWVGTIRKGVQKEKYHDGHFRALYPDAELTSKIDEYNPTKVVFTLTLGIGRVTENELGDC